MNLKLTSTRALGTSRLWLNQNSPTIMVAGGVLGFGITTALAIRQTAKAGAVMPEIAKSINEVRNGTVGLDEPVVEGTFIFEDRKDKARALAKVYVGSAKQVAKIYWPVFTAGAISSVLVLRGHGIMLKRNATIVTAYTALDTSYRLYRNRVAEEVGEDKERDLYRGFKTRLLPADPENGRLEACEVFDPADLQPEYSQYARVFDDTSQSWSRTPEYNLTFLLVQQQWANDRLNAVGFLFLNEVYEMLGLPRTQAGQHVGWKIGHPNHDGHVSFGIHRIDDEASKAFVNGHEPCVWLDFNVDGIITI